LDHEDLAGDPHQIVEHLDAVRVDVLQRRHTDRHVVLVVGELRQHVLGRALVDGDVLQLRVGPAQQRDGMRVDLDALEIGETLVVQIGEVAPDPTPHLQDGGVLRNHPVQHHEQAVAGRPRDARTDLTYCSATSSANCSASRTYYPASEPLRTTEDPWIRLKIGGHARDPTAPACRSANAVRASRRTWQPPAPGWCLPTRFSATVEYELIRHAGGRGRRPNSLRHGHKEYAMTTFTVWKFDSPEGAEHAATLLKNAADDGLVTILDHAVVSWPVGASQPEAKHTHDDKRRGAGWGAFWGLLIGSLFL